MTVSISTSSDAQTEKDEKRRDRKAKVDFPTKVGIAFRRLWNAQQKVSNKNYKKNVFQNQLNI